MNENKLGGMSQHVEHEAVTAECLTGRKSHLLMQSRARMKKSLLSWCSSRRRAHCSNVTDMDVRSLALLQLVNLMPFNLRQIWREGRKRKDNVEHRQITGGLQDGTTAPRGEKVQKIPVGLIIVPSCHWKYCRHALAFLPLPLIIW